MCALVVPPRRYSWSTSRAPPRPSRTGRQRLAHVGEQLAGPLVEADHRPLLVVGLLVEVQNRFHAPHERRAFSGRDHPLLEEVGTQFDFLSVRLTVS